MPRIERSKVLEGFRAMIARGEPIVGGGAGTGLSAKCEEAGGIDLIVIYNSGRYRMAGRGSLAGLMPYGDANQIVIEMAAEVRANLEETGMSYGLEVDMIAKARAKDMLTTPYVFCEDDARAMAEAGADIIVCHLGLTTGGSVGARTALQLADCPGRVDAWAEAALRVRRDVIVLVHGGPVAEPGDAAFIMKSTRNCHGFYGASSMERLPVELALTEQTRKFKRIGRG